MRFDRFDLNLLVALDVLLEEKSVSAAARRLNLSQPAVTGALNRLRDYFEDDLLVQCGRRMLLSPKAEDLAEPVRRALMQIRADITRPGDFDPATSHRRFTIVASDYAYTIVLAQALARMAVEAPDVSVDIMAPSARTSEMFERAEVDIFITISDVMQSNQPSEPLFKDHDVVISWKGAGYEAIDVETFYGASHAIAMFGADRILAFVDRQLALLGRERRIDVLLPNFGGLPQAVVGTRRLAIMHRLYAEHFAKLYPIALHPLPVPIPPITEVAQWHRIRDRDPGVLWVRGILRDEAARLPASAQASHGGDRTEPV